MDYLVKGEVLTDRLKHISAQNLREIVLLCVSERLLLQLVQNRSKSKSGSFFHLNLTKLQGMTSLQWNGRESPRNNILNESYSLFLFLWIHAQKKEPQAKLLTRTYCMLTKSHYPTWLILKRRLGDREKAIISKIKPGMMNTSIRFIFCTFHTSYFRPPSCLRNTVPSGCGDWFRKWIICRFSVCDFRIINSDEREKFTAGKDDSRIFTGPEMNCDG